MLRNGNFSKRGKELYCFGNKPVSILMGPSGDSEEKGHADACARMRTFVQFFVAAESTRTQAFIYKMSRPK